MKGILQIKMNYKALSICCVLLLAIGCSDDDVSTKTALLTAATWRYNFVNHPTPQLNPLYDSLFTGFEIKFNQDNTYNGKFPNDPVEPTFSGSWKWIADETELSLDEGTADEQSWQVTELTEGSLTLLVPDDNLFLFTVNLRND